MRTFKNRIWLFLRFFIGQELYEKIRAFYNTGYWPDFKNPRTFCEKIMHKKLYRDMDFAIKMSDKYEVREFVKEKIGDHVLNDVYFIGNDLRDVDWETIPEKFIIKTTHGCGCEGNIIVRDRRETSLRNIIKQNDINMSKRFGDYTNEYWYAKIKPRVMIEELLLDEKGRVPLDYKFLCFHGKCRYIQVNTDRFVHSRRSFYDRDWNYQDFAHRKQRGRVVEEPENLQELLFVAEKLAENFDFVRVDLYVHNGEVRFGELTFAPYSGWEPFSRHEKDQEMGALLNLEMAPV